MHGSLHYYSRSVSSGLRSTIPEYGVMTQTTLKPTVQETDIKRKAGL